ncbi:MAG: SDR family NAD(P)-dependent oxidoreductase [Chloroflexi bacterium]|nr:SDR family NAD(P)-dependent oxidoreductase [Chloroflexota bacterium]
MKHVVITGVSSGIGRAAAEELAARGYHVFGSVRRAEDGARLQADLGQNFTPLLFDVTDAAAIKSAVHNVEKIAGGGGLTALINNAGVAVSGPLSQLSLDEFRYQFEVNVFGVLAVTQAFLPLLGAGKDTGHPPGRVVNISSVNGRITYPLVVPYCASKHALESLSDGLRRELMIYGMEVIVVEPGAVRTPIWDKAEATDVAARFANGDYGPTLAVLQNAVIARGRDGLPPEAVARVIREALESRRPRTRYVLEQNYLMTWLLPRWLPDRWLDALLAGGQRMSSKTLRAIMRGAHL